eukprot:Nitzschia sp. Nitz4//scaffold125_size66327//65271//65870//NITZ4_006143-RA/size66327-processed-gene-0.36-mRNA-1//-1//CDS//3329534649//5635//frame0
MRVKDANAASNVVDLEVVEPPPSDYELLRMRNVQRNNERLKALGLLTVETTQKRKWIKKRTPTALQRKSRRLQGQLPEHQGILPDDVLVDSSNYSGHKGQEGSAPEPNTKKQPTKMLLPQEVQELPKNHTASYEHCLHRVRSMTHKQLANRIKMIERAAGQHALIKMDVFQTCLRDERLDALADLAAEALERLKGCVGK